MKKIIIILVVFILDRATKTYLISLQEGGTDIDFYIFPFLNFYLLWNTGIGFGLMELESNLYYHILTTIIVIINVVLIFFYYKSKRNLCLFVSNNNWWIFGKFIRSNILLCGSRFYRYTLRKLSLVCI